MGDRLLSTVNHLSLCAGIGGIDLGLRRVVRGLRSVAYVEREAFAAAHLVAAMEAGRLDPAPVYPDLHRFPWEQYRGLVDIVSGGFPCQPFSQAGKRNGVDDPRHLWPIIRDGLERIDAPVVFFENVEGITTAKSPGFECVLHHVLSDLEGLDYVATAGRFTAGEVGAPHRRRRWFVLAVRDPDSHGEPDGSLHAEAPRMRGDMADRNLEGLEGWIEPVVECSDEWPAGPGCPQGSNEPPRTTQPGLGRDADGVPGGLDPARDRVDRLRALGNAVVPACASLAFVELWKELVR